MNYVFSDDFPTADLPLSVATLNALHRGGIATVGQLRTERQKPGNTLRRINGIGRVMESQIVALLETGRSYRSSHYGHTPAQLRALARISEVTGHPSTCWAPVLRPPDMTWIDYVDADGKIGQCCRDGAGWRQMPIGAAPIVFLVYTGRT